MRRGTSARWYLMGRWSTSSMIVPTPRQRPGAGAIRGHGHSPYPTLLAILEPGGDGAFRVQGRCEAGSLSFPVLQARVGDRAAQPRGVASKVYSGGGGCQRRSHHCGHVCTIVPSHPNLHGTMHAFTSRDRRIEFYGSEEDHEKNSDKVDLSYSLDVNVTNAL